MKILLGILCFSIVASAEIFIGQTTAFHRLVVGTNETLRISGFMGADNRALLVQDGQTYELRFAPLGYQFPQFIVGPAEVVFTNASTGISFQRFTNSSIRWLKLPIGTTNTISVPEGKTIHFLGGFGEDPSFTEITVGSHVIEGVTIFQDNEYSGPALLRIGTRYYQSIISYYFTEDAVSVSGQKLLSGPTGNFEIVVERSADLTNWFPIIAHQTSASEKTFYRFRLTR